MASYQSLYIKNIGSKFIIITPDEPADGSEGCIVVNPWGWCDYKYGGNDPCNTILNDNRGSMMIAPSQSQLIVDGNKLDNNWWRSNPIYAGRYCMYKIYNGQSEKILHLKTSRQDYVTCVQEKGDGSINASYNSGLDLYVQDGNGSDKEGPLCN